MEQFQENRGILSETDFAKITKYKVLLVGLGGLGGHLANTLVRLGFHRLKLVDDDVFTVSNLNRQLYAIHTTIEKKKVDVTVQALKEINPNVEVSGYLKRVEALAPSVMAWADIIIDAVDHPATKCYLEAQATKHNKPLLHGAIGGWVGQLGIVLPHARLLNRLYENAVDGIEKTLKCPSFTPAIIANMMAAELVKFVQGKSTLMNRILSIDLYFHDMQMLSVFEDDTEIKLEDFYG